MSIELKPTIKTPGISFKADEGKISIYGISIPEDPQEFFEPLNSELDDYVKNPAEETILEFKLEYFNTSTTLIIRNVIRKLRDINNKTKLKVNWYYEEDDEDMEEAGEEFKMLFDNIDFELIGVNHF
jgi:response regulator RpfG family c-di-GMP phosphodiesterase